MKKLVGSLQQPHTLSGSLSKPKTLFGRLSNITATGTLEIAENGSYDVKNYANARVDVASIDLLEMVLLNTLTEYANDTLTVVKPYTFRNSTNLKVLNLPNVRTIRAQAFHTCTGLTSIDFPLLTTLESYAFTGCSNLVSVNFPILTYLQASSLQSCSKLEVADFPKVNQIGNLVFDGCSKLTKLILRNNEVCKLSNKGALTNTPIANGTGFIYVPNDLVASYKVATNWSTYANQFKPISELE